MSEAKFTFECEYYRGIFGKFIYAARIDWINVPLLICALIFEFKLR